jgi:hypothetical protein
MEPPPFPVFCVSVCVCVCILTYFERLIIIINTQIITIIKIPTPHFLISERSMASSCILLGQETHNVRKKGKAVPLHAMEALGGEEV